MERKLDNLMLFLLMGLYPLLAFRLEVGSVSVQSLFLFGVMVITLLIHFRKRREFEWKLPSVRNLLGCAVVLTGMGVVFSMVKKLFQDNELGHISFDGEVFLFAMIGAFVLIASQKSFQKYYFDFLVYSGLLVAGMMLYHYLVGAELDNAVLLLTEKDEAAASYMILLGTTCVLQYCGCREKGKSIFYAASALVSFFVLFLSENRVGIGIMVFVFVLIPILFRPTVELVKRDMQLFFLYLFLLSNMSLIVNYTDIVRMKPAYDLQSSVYLELAMAVGGIVFFHFWERIPEGADPDRLVLRRMRKGYQLLFRVLLILAAAALAGDADGRIMTGENVFRYLYVRTGVAGVLLLVLLLAVVIEKLHRSYHPDKPVTTRLLILSGTFIVQLFFWEPMIQTLPIYMILVLYALYMKEKRRAVTSKRINIEEREELEAYEKENAI